MLMSTFNERSQWNSFTATNAKHYVVNTETDNPGALSKAHANRLEALHHKEDCERGQTYLSLAPNWLGQCLSSTPRLRCLISPGKLLLLLLWDED